MENNEKIFLKEHEMNEYRVLQDKINQVIYSMGEVSVEKQILKELVEKDTPKLESQLFLKYHHEDGLRNLINKNVEYWLQSTFKNLISYN